MHVFVIGGSGFLSSKLVENFLARDVSVSMFHRGLNRPDFPDTDKLDIHLGDRDWPEDLRHAIGTREFDAVYDMVAYTPEQSRAVAEIFSERTARFIHCSTVSVYMVSDDVKCPIGENQDRLPLMKFWDRNPFGMDYGIKKRECEQVLWDAHDPTRFPVTMLRPTYISGPGDPAKRDYFWIERILDGQPLLVPGSGTFPFQNVFLDDVADAFVNIIKTDDSIGQAYNVAAEEIFTLDEYLKALGKIMGYEPELVHIDQDRFDRSDLSYNPAGDVFPFNTRRPAIFSLDKIKKDLSFLTTPLSKWMPETISWFMNKYPGHSTGYDRRKEELILIEEIQRNGKSL